MNGFPKFNLRSQTNFPWPKGAQTLKPFPLAESFFINGEERKNRAVNTFGAGCYKFIHIFTEYLLYPYRAGSEFWRQLQRSLIRPANLH